MAELGTKGVGCSMDRALRTSRGQRTSVLTSVTTQGAAAPSLAERRLRERLREELMRGPGAVRVRAAARLVERMGPAAGPLLGEAIAAAPEPAVLGELVELLGKSGAGEGLPLVRSLQEHPDAEVRCAAVAAAVALATADEDRRLVAERAIADEDPRVRRRAALEIATLRGFDAGPLLAGLLQDEDRHARRLACIGLGSTAEPEAALALVSALLDPDEGVRLAAGASLERLFGERAEGLARLSPQGRARAVPRLRTWIRGRLGSLAPEGKLLPPPARGEASLAALDEEEDVSLLEERPEGARAPLPAEAPVAAPAALSKRAAPVAEAAAAPAVAPEREPVAAHVDAEPPGEDALAPRVEGVLRAALRGATLEDLVREVGASEERLSSTVEGLVASGRIRRRGRKLFLS